MSNSIVCWPESCNLSDRVRLLPEKKCQLLSRVWLCDPMDCSPSGSFVHGIFQARVLEWVAISFSRDLPNPANEPRSPALQADSLPLSHQGSPFSQRVPSYFWHSPEIAYGPGHEVTGLYHPGLLPMNEWAGVLLLSLLAWRSLSRAGCYLQGCPRLPACRGASRSPVSCRPRWVDGLFPGIPGSEADYLAPQPLGSSKWFYRLFSSWGKTPGQWGGYHVVPSILHLAPPTLPPLNTSLQSTTLCESWMQTGVDVCL